VRKLAHVIPILHRSRFSKCKLFQAQHVSSTQFFLALGADPPSWDAGKAVCSIMQGKEVSSLFALHLTSVLFSLQPKSKRYVGIIFTCVCSSLKFVADLPSRLKAALRPEKADLERYVRLAHNTFA
jgi:hypothetical protein